MHCHMSYALSYVIYTLHKYLTGFILMILYRDEIKILIYFTKSNVRIMLCCSGCNNVVDEYIYLSLHSYG